MIYVDRLKQGCGSGFESGFNEFVDPDPTFESESRIQIQSVEKKINRGAPDTVLAGYPANPNAGYPAGQSGIRPDTGYKKGQIIRPDIRPAGYPVHP
jgi:hypothetical protein